MNELIRKASIDEICGHRARAVELYRQAAFTMRAAHDAAERALNGTNYNGLNRRELDSLSYTVNVESFAETARQNVDRQIWRHLIRATRLADYLDATAREAMEKGLDGDNVPAADSATVEATLVSLAKDSGSMLERGVVELFRSLKPEFKRHDAFKMTCRFVLKYARSQVTGRMSWQHWNHYSKGRDSLVDLERICCVMSGLPVPDYAESIACKVDAACNKGSNELTHGPLHVRWFQNGNVHVTLTAPELVSRLNQILAKAGGIPDGRSKRAA